MSHLESVITINYRKPFKMSQLDLSDRYQRILYENRRLEEIAMAQPSGRVIVRKKNSAVSAAEKQCLWGC